MDPLAFQCHFVCHRIGGLTQRGRDGRRARLGLCGEANAGPRTRARWGPGWGTRPRAVGAPAPRGRGQGEQEPCVPGCRPGRGPVWPVTSRLPCGRAPAVGVTVREACDTVQACPPHPASRPGMGAGEGQDSAFKSRLGSNEGRGVWPRSRDRPRPLRRARPTGLVSGGPSPWPPPRTWGVSLQSQL